MYQPKMQRAKDFKTNTSYTGESIEAMIRRMKHTKEPIKIGTGMIYTKRADKVNPELDPRADKMENLLEASIQINAAKAHARNQKGKIDLGKKPDEKQTEQNSGKPGSTSTTETTSN